MAMRRACVALAHLPEQVADLEHLVTAGLRLFMCSDWMSSQERRPPFI
jgi:hypothetical protein